jgi:TPP-dependent pyruvate/acetoin dehydrogenase alpha subunit
MLDCHTFRMGGYSSHFTVHRKHADAELAAWRKRDPIDFMANWLAEHAGLDARDLATVRSDEQAAIEQAYAAVRVEAGEPVAPVPAAAH